MARHPLALPRPDAAGGIPLAGHHARHPDGLLRPDHRAAKWLRQSCSSCNRSARVAWPCHGSTPSASGSSRSPSPFCSPPSCFPRAAPSPAGPATRRYSAIATAGPGQGAGMDCWLVSIGLFCIGSWFSAVNVLVTILTERARGMTLDRMPLTVWSWLRLVHPHPARLHRALRRARAALLRSPPRHGVLYPAGRLDQRPGRRPRRRLTAALAASLLVLRPSGGLHRHPPRHGTRLEPRSPISAAAPSSAIA